MRNAITLATISPLALLLAGCETSQRSYKYNPPPGQVISSGAYAGTESDRVLENSLRSQLNRYGDLAAVTPNLRIAAQNGAVTLSGPVPSERERQMIDAMVRNTPGVTGVNDQLVVSYPPTGYALGSGPNAPAAPVVTPPLAPINPANPPPSSGLAVQAASTSDRVVADRLADSLRNDPRLSTSMPGVDVSVTGGAVYLRGTVDDQQEHQALVSDAQRTPGVSAVYDQLQVR